MLIGFSCNQSNKSNDSSLHQHSQKKDDTLPITKVTNTNREENFDSIREANYQHLNVMLAEILKTVRPHIKDSFYQGSFDTSICHFNDMYAEFLFGTIFAPNRKHLIVKRFGDFGRSLYLTIYVLKNERFVPLVSDTADIGYSADTLLDVNQDGFKDYMVSQYSSAGCCPRDDKVAYLYNPQNGSFKTVGFFNPEFDDQHKVVYEMDYGHPGEVSISKSRWNNLSKIEVEMLSPNHFNDRLDSFVRPYSYVKTIYPGEKKISP